MSPRVALSQIAQIAVTAKDLARATAFYRDTLGMTLLFEVPGLAFFDCAGVRLMLSKPEQPEFDHPASIIYYKIQDIAAAAAALQAAGVTFDAAPHRVAQLATHDIWMAFFRDSEHNLLAITSEVTRA